MRVQLPAGLGSQYIERLDSSPFVEFNLRQKARKQAIEDATAQYFNDLPNTINTAGIAQKHLQGEHGGILNDIDLWKHNMMTNKDAIRKGGWAQQEAMREYQMLMRKIDQAKQRTKTELELGKEVLSGKYNPDDEDLEVIQKMGGSIYDPKTYKDDGVSEYSYMDLSPNVEPFDADKQAKFWTAATKGLTGGKVYDYDKKQVNPTTGQVIVPYKKVYSTEQIKKIGDEAGQLIESDKSARKHYKKILDSPDSEQWRILNDAYQKVYGKDKIVSTPQQAAQADAIIRASTPIEEGQEQELNYQQRQDDKRTNIFLNMSNRAATDENVNDVFKMIDRMATEKREEGKAYLQVNLLPLEAQKSVIDFANGVTNRSLAQKDLKVIKDDVGNLGVYYAKDNKLIGYLTQTGVNITKQPGVAEKRTVVERGSDLPKPTTKVKKSYSLKGKSYSIDQIEKAAKASNMSVDEYIKKAGLQ